MSKEILDQIKENSNIPLETLSESSTSSDIATTQDFIGTLIDEKYNYSLLYQICDVQPITSSFASIYASKRNELTNQLEVVRKDVNVGTDKISTGFSKEVWQDMNKQFGTSAGTKAGNILSGISSNNENRALLQLLESESEIKPLITLTEPDDWQQVIHQISMKVSKSVIEMNYKSLNSLKAFCILPPKYAAAILGSAGYMVEGKEESLFVGNIGHCDFYINPFPNTVSQFDDGFTFDFESEATGIPDYAYVGLKSKISGQSSLVFAPYSYEMQTVIDPISMEQSIFLFNRYGLITSPLHDKIEKKGMLHKFEIKV